MAASGKLRVDVEVFFRQIFSINDSVDIVPLMEAAITVVASTHPQELLKRRSRIIKTLMFGLNDSQDCDSDSDSDKINNMSETTTQKTDDHNDQHGKQQRHVIRIPARKRSNADGFTAHKKIDVRVSEDRLSAKMEVKFEESKRKLREGYNKLQEERAKKKIRVLDLKDAPPTTVRRSVLPQKKKNSTPKSRILQKLSSRKTSTQMRSRLVC